MGNSFSIREGWRLASTFTVKDDPRNVSSVGYQDKAWFPSAVPSTVLNTLVKNGVYPDPRIGLNNFLIPDASDEYNRSHGLEKFSHLPEKRNPWRDPYWFRTEFRAPSISATSRTWLVFDAINYRAEVWLNGFRLAGPQEMVGAFLRFRFDATSSLKNGELNCLAVKIYGPDHSGMATTQLEVFQKCRRSACGRIDDIHRDVTITDFALGYDNVPEVRDRLMGILQDVRLETGGPIVLRDPFVKTRLPLPQVDEAHLSVTTELLNATNFKVKGVLRGEIDGLELFSEELELMPGELRELNLTSEHHPKLLIKMPKLWWPAGYGEQHMYKMRLTFNIDGDVSDSKIVNFGVREVTKVLHELDGHHGLRVHINGQKIFCRGGYLVMPDTLMDGDVFNEKRFEAELRYLVDANLNTITMQEPANMPDSFHDLCDRLGIMYWLCFYQCNWLREYDFPLNHKLLELSGADIIKRYRNHPSIVAYMCQNEGAAERDQYMAWRRSVEVLDGTRIIIPSGYDHHNWGDPRKWAEWIIPDTPVGANDCQPKSYTWQPHSWYFRMAREQRSWMFKIESGSASLPTIESIRKMISDLGQTAPGAPFPLNSTWAHHGANDYYQNYDKAIRRRFGDPASVEDYCWKAHLVTADQNRSMFEAVNHVKWDVTSGFMQWKLNSAWPDVQWQLYDYYLRPTPSLYYVKKACEPVHIQMSPLDYMVSVINNRLTPLHLHKAKVQIYGLDAKRRWEMSATIDVKGDCREDIFQIPSEGNYGPVYFVKLELFDCKGELVSDNFYWLSSRKENIGDDALGAFLEPSRFDMFAEHHNRLGDEGAFLDLGKLPKVKPSLRYEFKRSGSEAVVEAEIENRSDNLAFFIRVMAVDSVTDKEFLPVYWSDNYFSLLPGETKRVTTVLPNDAVKGKSPVIKLDGWNVKPA